MALPTSGVLGQWGFDDGSGTTVTDYSGNGNHGTIMGTGATWTAKGLQTTLNSYVQAPHLDFYTGKQFTFIVACKFAFATSTPTLMGYEDEAQIYLSNNNKAVTFYTESPETELIVSTTGLLVADTDIVIAVTYDNANFRTYYNGVLNRTVAGANKITDGSGLFPFSDDNEAGYRDNFEFYYALAYDRVLTAQEVADAYAFIQAELASRGSLKVTPNGIAPTGAMGLPTLLPGNVGLLLDGIASTQLVGLPTLVPGGVILGLNSIPSSGQLGIPVLGSGIITLPLSGIPSGIQIGIPDIITGVPATKYIFPVGLTSIASIGSPTIVRSFKLTLSGIGNVSSLGNITIIKSSSPQTIELLGIGSSTQLGQPKIGKLLILLDGILPTLQIGNPIFIQVLCYVKIGGVWLLGEIRFKIDGGWQSGLNLLPKVEGNWKNKEVS